MTETAPIERAILGGLLLSPEKIEDLSLVPGDFMTSELRQVWTTMLRLHASGSVADAVTVGAELGKGELLGRLMDEAPGDYGLADYARRLREASKRRQFHDLGVEIQRRSREGQPADLAAFVAGELDHLEAGTTDPGPESVAEVCSRAFRQIEAAAENPGQLSGHSSGFRKLDLMTGGLQRGDLIIVAARPSMGKTALVCGIAKKVAAGEGASPVLFVSLEMSSEQLTARMIAAGAGVDLARMRVGRLHPGERRELAAASLRLEKALLHFDDRAALTVAEIRRAARQVKRKHGLGLVVVDYLQLCQGDGQTREQEVSSISRGLKALAKELGVPVIALSQLNRSLETRNDKRPIMADLRDSGGIEQDADLIAFIYREAVYCQECRQHRCTKGHDRDAELILAKQRNGPTGTILLDWNPETCMFKDRS